MRDDEAGAERKLIAFVLPDLRVVAWGGALFVVGWLWALASSATVLRASRRARQAGGPGRTMAFDERSHGEVNGSSGSSPAR